MTDLERSHHELRAALILAGKTIVRMNFGRRDNPTLSILRRTLRESRHAIAAHDPTSVASLPKYVDPTDPRHSP